ncbi:MAG TPA: glycosyltransferase family 2 protein [Gemmatimonadota bacterium]|nr:glycosyltransferase family 2 protein [Gemmatimonadota bacterium]
MTGSLRRTLGAAVHDWPRYAWHLRGRRTGRGARHWTRIGNRRDTIRVGPDGLGAECEGRWTSRLHGCDVFPSLGRRLMERALAEWPVGSAPEPSRYAGGSEPDVSFVIGHRGAERLPHLLLVLRSVAAQVDATVECVLVEQSAEPEVADRLPAWVRTLHTPVPRGTPYSRSWAFNVGARAARGRVLAFHDNDMLLPRRYAAELLARRAEGYEVVNLKRFVFYLGEAETRDVLQGARIEGAPDHVVQNLEGGGSVAVDRGAFFAIGGFDEAFVGWGGEDNEFWERSQVRTVWGWGYVPLVHLHHRDQPEKGRRDRRTAELLDLRSRVPPADRVRELTGRAFGRPEGPDPPFPRGERER